jgi:hypothetical protein
MKILFVVAIVTRLKVNPKLRAISFMTKRKRIFVKTMFVKTMFVKTMFVKTTFVKTMFVKTMSNKIEQV